MRNNSQLQKKKLPGNTATRGTETARRLISLDSSVCLQSQTCAHDSARKNTARLHARRSETSGPTRPAKARKRRDAPRRVNGSTRLLRHTCEAYLHEMLAPCEHPPPQAMCAHPHATHATNKDWQCSSIKRATQLQLASPSAMCQAVLELGNACIYNVSDRWLPHGTAHTL
jgi:hypothetical protein